MSNKEHINWAKENELMKDTEITKLLASKDWVIKLLYKQNQHLETKLNILEEAIHEIKQENEKHYININNLSILHYQFIYITIDNVYIRPSLVIYSNPDSGLLLLITNLIQNNINNIKIDNILELNPNMQIKRIHNNKQVGLSILEISNVYVQYPEIKFNTEECGIEGDVSVICCSDRETHEMMLNVRNIMGFDVEQMHINKQTFFTDFIVLPPETFRWLSDTFYLGYPVTNAAGNIIGIVSTPVELGISVTTNWSIYMMLKQFKTQIENEETKGISTSNVDNMLIALGELVAFMEPAD